MAKGYEESARQQFCMLAQVEGMVGAMKLLGFPKSKATASKWLEQYGIELTASALHKRASELKQWYSAKEKLTVLQEVIDACYEHLRRDEMTGRFEVLPSAPELTQLTNALSKAIQTMELLEGRATERTETLDAQDIELRQLIAEQNAADALSLKELSAEVRGDG